MQQLSQRDQRWGAVRIGPTHLTVHDKGCTLTCVSMLSDYFGEFMPPDKIARLPGLFDSTGRIIWSVLPKYFHKFKPVVRVQGRSDVRIKTSLVDPKQACILQVRNGAHWVLPVRGTQPAGDYICDDPWTGGKCQAIRDYKNISGSEHFVATT